MKKISLAINSVLFALAPAVYAQGSVNLPFGRPTLSGMVSFLIRFLFFFAGLAALLYLLLGAFNWITSSGDKEAVKKAQDKIQAAIIGLIVIVVAIVIIATLEQFVLKNAFCVGLTCNIDDTLPRLLDK